MQGYDAIHNIMQEALDRVQGVLPVAAPTPAPVIKSGWTTPKTAKNVSGFQTGHVLFMQLDGSHTNLFIDSG